MMYSEIYDFLSNILKYTESFIDDTRVWLVCNTKDSAYNSNNYNKHSIMTDFFSSIEMEQLLSSSKSFGFYTQHFNDAIDFINAVISKKYYKTEKKTSVVYATTQRGISDGKDSLIPSFCALNDIICVGSDAYVCSLVNNKYHYTKLLEYHKLPVPRTWRYDKKGWFQDLSPEENKKIIIKLTKECSSIGIDDSSVCLYSKRELILLDDEVREFNQSLTIQEFINGYEVEVPVIELNGNIITGFPVGIRINGINKIGDAFLTYDSIYNDYYEFYNFNEVSNDVGSKICLCAKEAVKILGLKGYARIDFRINENFEFFIIDITHCPHIVEHSSFSFMYENIGIGYDKILPSLVGITLKRQN